MNKKILFIASMVFAGNVMAQENQPLQVIFNGCKPTEVISRDESCGNGPDPSNQACRSDGAVVRWAPEASIEAITQKAGSPGKLQNCKAKPGQGYYQCVVTGNKDDHVAYNVTSKEGCKLDPIIIIK